jgi:hypothetical protein
VCRALEASLLHANLEIKAAASLGYWHAGHLSLPVGFQSWTQEGNDEVRIDQAGVFEIVFTWLFIIVYHNW